MKDNSVVICVLISLITLKTVNAQSTQKLKSASINGAWEMVWSNEKANPTGKAMEFKLYHDGFFSVLWQDTPGKWNHGAAGVYKLDGMLCNRSSNTIRTPLSYIGNFGKVLN